MTTPNTTLPSSVPDPGSGTGTSSLPAQAQCQGTILDYKVLRKNNINQINEYYNTLLNDYKDKYSLYAVQSKSPNPQDAINALSILKPQVENSNTQVINLSQKLIDNVNKDTDLIMNQKDQLDSKTKAIDSLMANINLLKDKNTDMTILTKSNKDSLNSTKTGSDDMKFTTQIYIGINILFVLIIISMIIYMMFSGFSSSKPSNNNTYKNIISNPSSL
jgi:hypothetical protein